MSSSGSSGSSASKGGAWEESLFFTPDAKKPGKSALEIKHSQLKTFFLDYEGHDEAPIMVKIWTNNLAWYVPQVAGAWHEFTIVQTKNWWWSFEKNSEGLCVQRGKTEDSVKNYYRGKKRVGTVCPEGRDPKKGRSEDNINDIFRWIFDGKFLYRDYHVTRSNCHYFASQLFEAVARQKGRKLN